MAIFNWARLPRAREIFGLLCVFLCLGAVLALATYDPGDPSWNTASWVEPPHNAIGRLGSSAADLAFQSFGLSAWLLPLMLLSTAWRSLRQREPASRLPRFTGFALTLLISSALLALAAPYVPWKGPNALGGTAGLLLSTSLTRYLNPPGTLLLLGALLLIALYLLSDFSVHGSGAWFRIRFAGLLPRFRRRPADASIGIAEQPPAPKRSRRKAEPDAEPVPFLPPPGLERDLEAYAEAVVAASRGSGGSR
jgi:S-DNA-T family DNA segregation ATPase FtsK/SpoIIIE